MTSTPSNLQPIRRLLVANRGEIAIRICRAARELGIFTIAIHSREDRDLAHCFAADVHCEVGVGKHPVAAYLDMDDILRVAKEQDAEAVHTGYGFLSENPDFAEACERNDIRFVGPRPATLRTLGNKVEARVLAQSVNVPMVPATSALPHDMTACQQLAQQIGYPVMVKASWGGGGRGMRVIETVEQLAPLLAEARRETLSAFGNDEVYLEKLVRNARHVEVQVLGDQHGTLVHLFERDCSVQRRHQKVVERAPAPYLDQQGRDTICSAALRLCSSVNYVGAGTVEFLMDSDTGAFYFIEVNPRVQVEHTVTEQVTGVDIIKAQLLIAQGGRIGQEDETGVPAQHNIRLNGHALQCRITCENPWQGFSPDFGRVTSYRAPGGTGVRIDGGILSAGMTISRHYDSLLEKLTVWGSTPAEAAQRATRALAEYRIAGVQTNIPFLHAIVQHAAFIDGTVTTRFVDSAPSLLPKRQAVDAISRLLDFIADVTLNGNPDMRGRQIPAVIVQPSQPVRMHDSIKPGTRQLLEQLGPVGFSNWMLQQERLLITDTTLRDAHQSLLATRMRSHDLLSAADAYAHNMPQLLSLECWGGATFDVAMRFLREDPWERLHGLRERVPNLLLQMLLRGANGVGYTSYPENVVRFFVRHAAESGIDLFRVFDSLNLVDNMRVSIDAILESGKLCEGTLCYTGDVLNPSADNKYNLQYYVKLAESLKAAGCHIIGIKDMAGVCRPAAARLLVTTLKQEIGLPVHFHTHDTSGFAAASILAAVEAGVDAVDVAIDAMSGFTSQPSLGSLVNAYRHQPRDTGIDMGAVRLMASWWEQTRELYQPFESPIHAATSDVYRHAMPGGQYTNLREQARGIGLGDDRWVEVADAYATVNRLFGDIVKVTPSSKVVGDMALMMVSAGITEQDVVDPKKDIPFPASVVGLFKGELGLPPDGFPAALSRKIIKTDQKPKPLPAPAPVDLEKARTQRNSDDDLASWLMYPVVFDEFDRHRQRYGDVSLLPTSVFLYGMKPGQSVQINLADGHATSIRLDAISEPAADQSRILFFRVDGAQHQVRVLPLQTAGAQQRPKADPAQEGHVGAPIAGVITAINVAQGAKVKVGDRLMTVEAMKMETAITATRAGVIEKLLATQHEQVEVGELLVQIA
jgi:pyruvate carboxylase